MAPLDDHVQSAWYWPNSHVVRAVHLAFMHVMLNECLSARRCTCLLSSCYQFGSPCPCPCLSLAVHQTLPTPLPLPLPLPLTLETQHNFQGRAG